MGITRKPSYRDYWASDPDLHNEFISRLMTVKRFSFLLSHLHLNDNSMQPRHDSQNLDKLYKLRPLIDNLCNSFSKCYSAHAEVAVDESMVKFQGRSSLKQCMRDKPTKRGYKIWMLCDKSGYNLKFQVYTSKVREKRPEKGLAARVVVDLTNEIQGKNHIVYMDNYFSSYALFKELKGKQIFACGTVNPTRKDFPKLQSDKVLKRGEFDFLVSGDGISV